MGNSGPLSVVFWNVWYKSQVNAGKLDVLKNSVDEIINLYNPEIFGLNEVLALKETNKSALLEHLESRGYNTHFIGYSPKDNGYVSGTALVSKKKPENIKIIEIGPHTTAKVRGLGDHTVKMIVADYPVPALKDLSIAVTHMAHIVPYNWKTHLVHLKNLRSLLDQDYMKENAIIGGDFNEFKHMPALWNSNKDHNRRTGSYINPTWAWQGLPISPVRANYDNIMWTKRGGLALKDFQVLPKKPSDHAPIIGIFSISSKAI